MGRKKIYTAATAALLVFGAGTALYAFLNIFQKDQTPPVISAAQQEIRVSVEDPQEKLLEGITVQDDRDGDVSDLTVIESISNITPEKTATVTYAAFDRSGNVAKTTRTAVFTDYESPRFYQRRALVMPEGGNQDVLNYVGAGDVVDGDLSGHIKGNLVSDTLSLNQPGAHRVEFRVTNSMGDTARLTLPVDVYPATAYNASVSLREYLIYLPVGSSFSPEEYPASLQVGSQSYSIADPDEDTQVFINEPVSGSALHQIRVEVHSDVDTDVPGVYSVTYTVTMDEQYTGFTRLNVIVEE